ncbi:MAG: YtxH domain-containing protein [Acidobacteriota bacterium]
MASKGEKFLYFMVGGFVGASIGMLFAPKTGEETRSLFQSKYREGSEKLTQRAREGKEVVSGTYNQMVGKVTETIDKGKETISRRKDQVSAAIEAGKEAYNQEKSRIGTPEGEAGNQ